MLFGNSGDSIPNWVRLVSGRDALKIKVTATLNYKCYRSLYR
jgi:hypothetical protein